MRLRPLALAAIVAIALVVGFAAGVAFLDRDHQVEEEERGQRIEEKERGQGRQAVVWAVGDGADGGDNAQQVVDLIAFADFDWLLYLRDVYDDGTEEDVNDSYATTYGKLANRTLPTPGNHEWDNREEGYDPYWEQARGEPIPP